MLSRRRNLFTQGCSTPENREIPEGSPVPVVRRISSAVERSRHMREVVGSTPTSSTTLSQIEIAHFWGKVDVGYDFVCWPWKGRKNDKGYGRFRDGMAHKIACELVHGQGPAEQFALHSCDNPPCCNPRHLRWGTYQDNSNDAVQRGRTARGERLGKLTREQVEFIRGNPEGMTGEAMAKKFGVAKSTISYVRSGRSWKYGARP